MDGLCPGLGLPSDWGQGRTEGIAQDEGHSVRRGRATASHPAAKPERRPAYLTFFYNVEKILPKLKYNYEEIQLLHCRV